MFVLIDLLSKVFQRYSLCVHFDIFPPDPYADGEVGEGDNDAKGGDDPQVPGLLVHLLLRVVVPLVTSLHRVVTHGEAADQILLFQVSRTSLDQGGGTQIWKRNLLLKIILIQIRLFGGLVTEHLEIASWMFWSLTV